MIGDRATVIHGDARRLPLDNATVDAVVCDPPYELGFMGRCWDSTGVAYDVATWREAMRVLKPGGHLLAFGGSRTWHRLACAIEDAGFELRDSIAWLYGSGFPKSHDVSKAIDKAAGVKREVVGTAPDRWTGKGSVMNRNGRDVVNGLATGEPVSLTGPPATDDACRWQGWGTALKPAFEPIVVARKPLAGTVAQNVLAYGTGALNIDGCRVGTATRTNSSRPRAERTGFIKGFVAGTETAAHEHGRWPTNVVLSHQPLLNGDGVVVGDACADGCVEGCQVAELDAQSGERPTGAHKGFTRANRAGWTGPMPIESVYTKPADTGGASRYFPTFRYQAKAPTKERPKANGVAHPTVKPLALMRWLVRLATPPGGVVLDPFAGSGATIEAALLEDLRVIGVELDATYLPLIDVRLDRALAAAKE